MTLRSAPAAAPARACGALEVARVAANLPFVLRTVVGLAVLGISINIIGVLIVMLVTWAMNVHTSHSELEAVLVAASISTLAAVALGVAAATTLQRRTVRWLLRGETPTEEDARRVVRMPGQMAMITIVLWSIGAVVIGVTAGVAGADAPTLTGLVGGIVLAGLASSGTTNLLMWRVNQPVVRLALLAAPPRSSPALSVRYRLLYAWALTSAVPLLGIVLVLAAPRGKTHVNAVASTIAVLAIALGALVSTLLVRAIASPLRDVVDGLAAVAAGDLDVSVEVVEPGEIGLVQRGFNQMVDGLRERERIQDLFGRHVGTSVAEQAISSGVTLRGVQLKL